MTIIRSTPNLDKRDIYFLTKSPEVQRMRDLQGQSINIRDYIIYIREGDENRADSKVCCIRDMNGTAYATNSATFIGSFIDLIDIFGNELTSVKVVGGLTKTGRPFIDCALA